MVAVAFVALSRVYLRAHYLTDVLGGVSLGLAIWALAGIAALFAGARASQWRAIVSNDDQITYAVAGAAALVSLVAWIVLIVVPAWSSYWRLRERHPGRRDERLHPGRVRRDGRVRGRGLPLLLRPALSPQPH